MKAPCVEFYTTPAVLDLSATHGSIFSERQYAWRLRAAKNGQIILSPHETFISHRNAVESFKRICNALDARGPWEIRDADGVTGSHAMLTKKIKEAA